MKRIMGILGAGQLAAMLARSALGRGLAVAVYANNLQEPACAHADNVMISSENDLENLKKFFKFCSFVVLENEFFSPVLLEQLQRESGTKIYPEVVAYKKLATKLKQKEFFKECRIPMAKTIVIHSENDLVNITTPVMLKHASGGYDGYGNLKVTKNTELFEVVKNFTKNFTIESFAEELIDIKNEYACMLIKGQSSSLILPPVRTIQKNNICHQVDFPSGLGEEQEAKLTEYMQSIDEYIEGKGVFAFEFFENQSGELIINEAAPRVHNSYHFSIEGFDRSQFDLMLDVVQGGPIDSVKTQYKYLSMINLLGQRDTQDYRLMIPEVNKDFEYKVHMYGKKDSRLGRKLGHMTLFSNKETNGHAKQINQEYRL